MPILEQGYQPWRGTLLRANRRPLSIAREALRRNNRWWVWALAVAALFFGSIKEYFLVFMVYVPAAVFDVDATDIPSFFHALAEHPRFYSDMMATQSYWAVVLGITLGAGEIAEDMRTGALTFLLGRPVTRRDYLLGKAAAVAAAVVAVTLVPVLVLFTAQALFEGTWEWFAARWTVPLRAAAYAAVLSLFVSGVVLGISAVARRRLVATVAIAGALVALSVTSSILAPPVAWTSHSEEQALHRTLEKATTREERQAAMKRYEDAFDDLGSRSDTAGWKVLSPMASLAACTRDLFGNPLPSNFSGGRHWFLVLGLPTLFYGILVRRIRAVEVVS
jgi:hypothetical protein